jgi:DNA-directed RNA polymerase specialized sigma subunit
MNNWQIWFTNNYALISLWAKRWSPEYWSEMLSQMAIYLHKNWPKFSQIPDGEERIKFLQTWMKHQVTWSNSYLHKELRVNNLGEELDIPDKEYDDLIEIKSEILRDDIKDWLIDLNQNWSDLEIDRLIKIRKIYLTLPSHQKVLYDLYFTKMMSMRDIGRKIDLPLSAVHSMIKELKEKIRNDL